MGIFITGGVIYRSSLLKHLDEHRYRLLNQYEYRGGAVLYWMSRDQRVADNWALLHAQELAIRYNQKLIVVFNLLPGYLGATPRQYNFMLMGLREVEDKLHSLNIPFYVLTGEPAETISHFIKKHNVGLLVADFNPLKINKHWKMRVSTQITIPFYEVDAHNIIPCWHLSEKQEYAARTIRPRINKVLDKYLTNFPRIKKQTTGAISVGERIEWEKVYNSLDIDRKIGTVDWIEPGEKNASKEMRYFVKHKLADYASLRNDPNEDVQSNLSPYLHFGQISAQRVAWEVSKGEVNLESRDAFLEELIVRKELSDNFCYYNENYDNPDGFPDWAGKTLDEHRHDKRDYVYSLEIFENSETHDPLWNAAQAEMVKRGKMHGYMRMYWAKKILEWSDSPEKAMETAIYLNDKYELDGRDPNGYTGVAWSIGGVHDRPWTEREIFGKVRYMNYNGCKRKFDVEKYIQSIKEL
ncbi:MAG: deoxyribodipyrimidine photo-lyase [candidate division Zixibacteria bacterium]|nr:deoxyribodipyrimidine photo-lyase [candidate division Zixibacteria bacterium]